jgi:DNA primase large subunit
MLTKENGYFPFLEISKKEFQNTIPNFDVEDLDESLIIFSKNRLLQSLKYKRITIPTYIKDKPNDLDNDIIRDIKSYILTRILASLIKRRINNYIEAESFRAIEIAQREKLIDYLMRELGIEIDGDFCMSLPTYLKYSSTFTHMKLSNRDVSKGKVKLNDYEINVIVREAVKVKLKENFPIRSNLISDSLKERLKHILKKSLHKFN